MGACTTSRDIRALHYTQPIPTRSIRNEYAVSRMMMHQELEEIVRIRWVQTLCYISRSSSSSTKITDVPDRRALPVSSTLWLSLIVPTAQTPRALLVCWRTGHQAIPELLLGISLHESGVYRSTVHAFEVDERLSSVPRPPSPQTPSFSNKRLFFTLVLVDMSTACAI